MGGKLNASYCCIDQHLPTRADQVRVQDRVGVGVGVGIEVRVRVGVGVGVGVRVGV